MDDTEYPASLTISRRGEGHAQTGDDPEGDDCNCCANAVGRDSNADTGVVHGESKNGGDYGSQPNSPKENQVDAIALDAE